MFQVDNHLVSDPRAKKEAVYLQVAANTNQYFLKEMERFVILAP